MFLGGLSPADQAVDAHTALHGHVPYVAYPPPDSVEVRRYEKRCCTTRAFARGDVNVVFVGQVPRLLPLPYIPWALDMLLEEYGVRWVLQTQANGCAKAWLEDEDQCTALMKRSKRLLFDVCGVWHARTDAEVERLQEYQRQLQQAGPVDARVPRHGVIIEKLRPPQQPKPTNAPLTLKPQPGQSGGMQRQFAPPQQQQAQSFVPPPPGYTQTAEMQQQQQQQPQPGLQQHQQQPQGFHRPLQGMATVPQPGFPGGFRPAAAVQSGSPVPATNNNTQLQFSGGALDAGARPWEISTSAFSQHADASVSQPSDSWPTTAAGWTFGR